MKYSWLLLRQFTLTRGYVFVILGAFLNKFIKTTLKWVSKPHLAGLFIGAKLATFIVITFFLKYWSWCLLESFLKLLVLDYLQFRLLCIYINLSFWLVHLIIFWLLVSLFMGVFEINLLGTHLLLWNLIIILLLDCFYLTILRAQFNCAVICNIQLWVSHFDWIILTKILWAQAHVEVWEDRGHLIREFSWNVLIDL